MTRKRTDLDQRAYELRQQGLTYRAIAKWLGVTLAMARRRVLRHERMLREAGKSADGSRLARATCPSPPWACRQRRSSRSSSSSRPTSGAKEAVCRTAMRRRRPSRPFRLLPAGGLHPTLSAGPPLPRTFTQSGNTQSLAEECANLAWIRRRDYPRRREDRRVARRGRHAHGLSASCTPTRAAL
jgi:hypothetical protein